MMTIENTDRMLLADEFSKPACTGLVRLHSGNTSREIKRVITQYLEETG